MRTSKVTGDIWKFTGSDAVNVYLLKADRNIMIDAGNRADHEALKEEIGKVVNLESVDLVLFTHLHYDHQGNADLFTNAAFYASEKEIGDFRSGALKVFAEEDVAWLGDRLKPLPKSVEGLKVIPAPGHTAGGVMFYLEDRGILFTGDTYFREGIYGRTDLPTSSDDDMDKSIKKVRDLKPSILCPGHSY